MGKGKKKREIKCKTITEDGKPQREHEKKMELYTQETVCLHGDIGYDLLHTPYSQSLIMCCNLVSGITCYVFTYSEYSLYYIFYIFIYRFQFHMKLQM